MAVLLLLVSILSCSAPDPYRIGFLGSLTGPLGDTGVAARNGVILAIEQANRAGNLSGRRVELLIEDDGGTSERVLESMEYFAAQGVVGVVGPIRAEMARIAGPRAEKAKIVLISPAANSADFPEWKDYFYRVSPSDKEEVQQLAELAFRKRGYRSISILYDLSNREFTDNRVRYFTDAMEAFGGSIVQLTAYTTRDDTDFGLLAGQAGKNNPDAVFILADTFDLARICRQLKKQGHEIGLLASGWSVTPELIRQAGAAVEGLEFYQSYDFDSTTALYQDFLNDYADRFHQEPEVAALYAYESAQIVLAALEKAKKKKNLGEVIREITAFKGLQDTIVFDGQGIAERPLYHKKISNGAIVTVGRE
ncbi:MAG: ABC transporter substrate-binding protein [Desulfocapsaceae bacterium]|nr:ABC transporter substrate-binding protein [Desulfocapsaceae bacterium]